MENPYGAPAAAVDELDIAKENRAPFLALDGRIGRWRFIGYSGLMCFCMLFVLALISVVLYALISNKEALKVVNIMSNTMHLAPIFFMARRRLQDMTHSGWWALSLLVPGVNLLTMLYLVLGPGMPGVNSYGAPPPENPIWVYPASLLTLALFRNLLGLG